MTSTVAQPGPFDPIKHSDPNEPYFPIMAHDPIGARTVRIWCDLRRKLLFLSNYTAPDGSNPVPEPVRLELMQISEAEQIADDMEAWVKGTTTDARVDGAPARYNETPPDTVTVEQAREAARRAKQIEHLREAAYHIQEALDLNGLDAVMRVRVAEAQRLINDSADKL